MIWEESVAICSFGKGRQNVDFSNQDEFKVLQYAAGATNIPDIDLLKPNQELTTKLLIQHRVVHAFLKRLAGKFCEVRLELNRRFELEMFPFEKMPSWCSVGFIEYLIQYDQQQIVIAIEQRACLVRLASQSSNANQPLIVINGPAINDILASDGYFRPSSNVNILAHSSGSVWRALFSQGYRCEHAEGRHEYARFFRSSVIFQLHRNFPLWSYPDGMLEMWSSQQNGSFTAQGQRDDVVCGKLSYHDLVSTSVQTISMGINIRRPSAEMSVLILMSQMLENQICSPLKCRIALLIHEVSELNQLINLPEFDFSVLKRLIDKHSNEECLSYCAWCLNEIYGKETKPEFQAYLGERKSFPRRIISDSFNRYGWYCQQTLEQSILPIDLPELLHIVPHNTLVVDDEGLGRPAAENNVLGSSSGNRIQSVDGSFDIGFELHLRRMGDRMAITINLESCTEQRSYYVGMYFPEELRLWTLITTSKGALQILGNLPTGSVAFDPNRRRITCLITESVCKYLTQNCVEMLLIISAFTGELEFDKQVAQPTVIAVSISRAQMPFPHVDGTDHKLILTAAANDDAFSEN